MLSANGVRVHGPSCADDFLEVLGFGRADSPGQPVRVSLFGAKVNAARQGGTYAPERRLGTINS
jgi:hypothetical protein